jgi:membrane-associated HD superfamily phosphohydrolase
MRRTREYLLLYLVISAVIGVSLVGVGCSHTPPRPVELDQARLAYAEARDNPQVASRAPVALREAEEALLRAEQTWDKDKDVREVQNLAAVARQRAEVARAAAEQKQAEAELEELTAARDRLLLDARTREAQRAQGQAERAQRQADQAFQQVRATTTQNQQLEQELNYTKEELAAREAAAKAPAKTCYNSRGVPYPCRARTR